MPQSGRIVAATKQALRRRGLTYADVAAHLGLSEASVKRLFTRGPMSLERLEAVARLLGMDLSELVREAERLDELPGQLTLAQEEYLVARPKLLLVFYLLLNGFELERIVADFQVERAEGILLLGELESLGLIERRPGDRVRLRVARELSWRAQGPIRRFIDQRVLREFLRGDFDGPGSDFHFVSAILSPAALARLKREVERLIRRFNDQVRAESEQRPEARRGFSLLVAMRPWRFSVFTEYERDGEGRSS